MFREILTEIMPYVIFSVEMRNLTGTGVPSVESWISVELDICGLNIVCEPLS